MLPCVKIIRSGCLQLRVETALKYLQEIPTWGQDVFLDLLSPIKSVEPTDKLTASVRGARPCVCVNVWRVCPATDPRLNWLSQGVNGLPASSCGRRATDRPVAFSPRVRPREGDAIVSVLALLKSPLVDVEDFDRVVGAGAGQLEPGAVLLRFTPRVGLSVFLVVVSTCSAGPGPPAEPLDRQSVALSVGERVMKGDNGGAALEDYACQLLLQ